MGQGRGSEGKEEMERGRERGRGKRRDWRGEASRLQGVINTSWNIKFPVSAFSRDALKRPLKAGPRRDHQHSTYTGSRGGSSLVPIIFVCTINRKSAPKT